MSEKIEHCCTGNDSEIFEEYIAHCIRKHVKGNVEPKLTQEQCVAAAFAKLRKGELRRKSDSLFIIAGDEIIKLKDTDDPRTDILKGIREVFRSLKEIEPANARSNAHKREALRILTDIRDIATRMR